MILTPNNNNIDIDACAINEVQKTDKPAIVSIENRIDVDQPHDVSLNRSFFSYGGHELALDSELIGEAFLLSGTLRLKGWGIEVLLKGQQNFNLDREIIRRFLWLLSKSEADSLSETEREEWASIVDQVDYQRFCAERSSPVYMEGKLLEVKNNEWNVVWHDGSEQSISHACGQQLSLVNISESFGAMVKFGRNRDVESLDKLTFISEPETTSEELWDSWGTANS